MREIKFRGRDEDVWVYGSLIKNRGLPIEIFKESTYFETVAVDPDTVGQFTGLLDSEGREIYEGDIVITDDWSSPSYIRWDETTASFVVNRWSVNLAHVVRIKVIGNVYDNPELLERKS